MGESNLLRVSPSNFRGGKFVTKKIGADAKRILFRDLVRLVSPSKPAAFLAARTGKHQRTAKRWLAGKSRAPAGAVYAVLSDILARID